MIFAASLVPFRYREELISAVLSRVALPIAALISMTAALLVFCGRSARRWRV
jgi:hypothetical protein